MIYIGSDHGGFELRQVLLKHLGKKAKDCGTFSKESCDYPDIAKEVCSKMQEGDLGILVCGTGNGMSMTANKIKGIRAAVIGDTFSAKMAKMHNNANVICLGERVTGQSLALTMVDAFLEAEFQGGRHLRRVKKIEKV